MAATVSFGMPYASRICSIFPLLKSTNSIVTCRFFCPYVFKDSTDSQVLYLGSSSLIRDHPF